MHWDDRYPINDLRRWRVIAAGVPTEGIKGQLTRFHALEQAQCH
jgi:hypothetical protein